ncbi:hypothetical protein TNCV_2201671 [Trichonephila clavipes]|nr:hypothetical protein TNCV_2201671 [Trichonephila clavipes]
MARKSEKALFGRNFAIKLSEDLVAPWVMSHVFVMVTNLPEVRTCHSRSVQELRRLSPKASQALTSLYPADTGVTGAVPTSIFGFKVHHARGDKDQWLQSNPGYIQTEMILPHNSILVSRTCSPLIDTSRGNPYTLRNSNTLKPTLSSINFQISLNYFTLIVTY